MPKNLKEKFKLFCNSKNLDLNQNQILTIQRLQNFYDQHFSLSIFNFFKKKNIKKGFYLYGGVGVGKTMILDFFYNIIPQKKLRLHFNEFMLNFHNFVHENKNQGDENIVNLFVKNLKSKVSLIYFDEFQVTNIVDAMILGKLFDKIFNEKIKIIITSNIMISDLYKDGLQRDQFKPFIKIMKEKTVEHELLIEDDYRKTPNNQNNRYFFPLSNFFSVPGNIKKFGSFKFSYKFEVESLHPIILSGKALTSLVTASTENLYPLSNSKLNKTIFILGILEMINE